MNQAGFAPLALNVPRRWDFLSGLMLSQQLKSFVEVGCKEGRTTGHILRSVPDSYVIAIDPWESIENAAETYVGTNEAGKKWDWEDIEKEFWKNVAEHRERVEMWKTTSLDAAKHVPASSYDMVFIDAAHDYTNVFQDIRLWWPKVKLSGILCGHDFNHKWPGVERAVADCFDLMHVGVGPDSVWFVLKAQEDQCQNAL